jgi:hypothetical protein
VYELPAAPQQLTRIEEALRQRESVRERLFTADVPRPQAAGAG